MRALIMKEVAESWPLVLFSALLAVLFLVGGVLLHVLLGTTTDDLRTLWAGLALIVPPVLGLVAGAPLFAGERTKGTLPLLFSLPLSRGNIWWAKVAGGLLLTVLASLALALPLGAGLVTLPSAEVVWAALPIVAMIVLLTFSLGLFCSSLSERPLNALLAGLLLVPLAVIWVYVPMNALEGRLTAAAAGPLFGDYALTFALLLIFIPVPALLAASAAVARWGEVLTNGRKWGLALLTLLAVLVATGVCTAFVSFVVLPEPPRAALSAALRLFAK